MKISELIKRLEVVKAKHGDLDVYAWPYDGQGALPREELELEPVFSQMAGDKKILLIE